MNAELRAMWDDYNPGHESHQITPQAVIDLYNRATCSCGATLRMSFYQALFWVPKGTPREVAGLIRALRAGDYQASAVANTAPTDGTCKTCGDAGSWVNLALMCRNGHGKICG